jgi:hypothetical protein
MRKANAVYTALFALSLPCAMVACTSGQSSVTPVVQTANSPASIAAATRATATASPASTYYGCPAFAPGGYYNSVVTTASLDPNSAAYISSMHNAGDTAGFYASTNVEKINEATDGTPMLTVHPKVSWHSFGVAYPWASGFYIEPLGDAHAIVVQTQSCHLYESYETSYSGGTLSAYSGANWNLNSAFAPMPPGTPSAMASGLSMFAGMVRWEDYQSGSIKHALNWAGIAHTVSQYGFVVPASDTDGLTFKGTSSYQLPYGAHLRLKSTVSTAGWGPESTMVANAMKTYGVYLADTGSSGNAIYFSNASNGTNPWSSSDLASLSKLHITDFDVLTLPAVHSTH